MKKKQRQENLPSKKPSANAASLFKPEYYFALLFIVLISFIVYLPALRNGLLNWDDDKYIQNNLLIRSINLKEIFSRYVQGNYHPLTMLTYAIEYHFFGLSAVGYHTVNLAIHLLNIVLVFYAVYLLSERTGVALVASLLFGVHPIHVESVAWASELKDLLYTFFFLASYISYLKYLKDQQKIFYVLALLLFVVSLLSKAMAASLPVVLVLTDYFIRKDSDGTGRKINSKTWLEKVPFFLLALTFGVVAVHAQKLTVITDSSIFTFPQRLVFACYGFMSYLFKLMWPLNLSSYYPYPVKNGADIPFQYYAYLLFFSGLAAFVFYSLRFTRKIIFGLGFFAVTVFLVLQLLPVGGTIMADRYCYIPSIGIFYLAGEGFNLLWSRKLKLVVITLLSVFTVFFSVKTYARCSVWKNDMTLWNDVISQNQTIAVAYISRGIAFYKEKKNDEALSDFNKAVELSPDFPDAFFNRGSLFANLKRNDEALNDFNRTIELKRDYAQAYNNRGIVYYTEMKYQEALSDFSRAIELEHDYAESYFYRGWIEYYSDKKDAACMDLKQAERLKYQRAAEAIHLICN
ncbi:MAG TPA: tetratricopeptide repeat protein [Chitinophagales bacterium]|nr:tetratricopeptide repeat protein [Chitinophagales bacterium]